MTDEEQTKPKRQKIIIVHCKKQGFRRLGKSWDLITELKHLELTRDELKILENDPMFKIQRRG